MPSFFGLAGRSRGPTAMSESDSLSSSSLSLLDGADEESLSDSIDEESLSESSTQNRSSPLLPCCMLSLAFFVIAQTFDLDGAALIGRPH